MNNPAPIQNYQFQHVPNNMLLGHPVRGEEDLESLENAMIDFNGGQASSHSEYPVGQGALLPGPESTDSSDLYGLRSGTDETLGSSFASTNSSLHSQPRWKANEDQEHHLPHARSFPTSVHQSTRRASDAAVHSNENCSLQYVVNETAFGQQQYHPAIPRTAHTGERGQYLAVPHASHALRLRSTSSPSTIRHVAHTSLDGPVTHRFKPRTAVVNQILDSGPSSSHVPITLQRTNTASQAAPTEPPIPTGVENVFKACIERENERGHGDDVPRAAQIHNFLGYIERIVEESPNDTQAWMSQVKRGTARRSASRRQSTARRDNQKLVPSGPVLERVLKYLQKCREKGCQQVTNALGNQHRCPEPDCHRLFREYKDWLRHRENKHPTKLYLCILCGDVFDRHIWDHILKTHEVEKGRYDDFRREIEYDPDDFHIRCLFGDCLMLDVVFTGRRSAQLDAYHRHVFDKHTAQPLPRTSFGHHGSNSSPPGPPDGHGGNGGKGEHDRGSHTSHLAQFSFSSQQPWSQTGTGTNQDYSGQRHYDYGEATDHEADEPESGRMRNRMPSDARSSRPHIASPRRVLNDDHELEFSLDMLFLGDLMEPAEEPRKIVEGRTSGTVDDAPTTAANKDRQRMSSALVAVKSRNERCSKPKRPTSADSSLVDDEALLHILGKADRSRVQAFDNAGQKVMARKRYQHLPLDNLVRGGLTCPFVALSKLILLVAYPDFGGPKESAEAFRHEMDVLQVVAPAFLTTHLEILSAVSWLRGQLFSSSSTGLVNGTEVTIAEENMGDSDMPLGQSLSARLTDGPVGI